MTELTIPLAPQVLLVIVVSSLFALATFLTVLGMRLKDDDKSHPVSNFQAHLGLQMMPPYLFVLAVTVWGMLFLILGVGLILSIYETIWASPPATNDVWNWRFSLVKLTALTTVTAAVIALPLTLIRVELTREQIKHASDSLYNDKMNTAVADLYAQKQVTRWKEDKAENGWEDDIPRRNGAIDRLEGLVREDKSLAPRVLRMLSIYVRELSRVEAPPKPVGDRTGADLRKWASELKVARSDMEKAVQTLGRLPDAADGDGQPVYPDLQGANLQGMRLSGLNFENAILSEVHLQGAFLEGANFIGANMQKAHLIRAELQWAKLIGAQLQGADLFQAQLPGAKLTKTQLRGARLSGAHLQGADLTFAQLQGARLLAPQFDTKTDLTAANLRGAVLRFADCTNVPQITDHLAGLFGDSTVKLPKGIDRPERFDVVYKNVGDFVTAWREFQQSIGQDPHNPE